MVQFNDVDEFLDNLDKDRDLVERRIVRVTNLYRASKLTASIQHVSVVATARVSGEIVRLEVYCGDLWNLGRDEAVLEKASSLQRLLAEACAALKLEVRAGILENGTVSP